MDEVQESGNRILHNPTNPFIKECYRRGTVDIYQKACVCVPEGVRYATPNFIYLLYSPSVPVTPEAPPDAIEDRHSNNPALRPSAIPLIMYQLLFLHKEIKIRPLTIPSFVPSLRYLVIAILLLVTVAHSAFANMDTAEIEKLTGLKGTYSKEENVFKVSKPRNDVKIQVDEWTMPPFMGLGSWAAFTPMQGGQIVMMGDTVLFEDEVNPAISAAFESGLKVTALHNHFFFDEPKVYFMHIGGTGSSAKLAAGVKRIYDKVAEIRAANPTPSSRFDRAIPTENKISAQPLEQILGMKGSSKDGMFKVVIGRHATIHGVSVGKEMGVNTWAAFAGTDSEAVVDEDFAMLANEMQAVLRTMRAGGMNIVAIHQHMTHEKPHYLFMHYWGKGNAKDLAKTIRSALNAQADHPE